MECLLYHQFIAMRAARVIDPGPFIQPPRLNDKRIVVHPFSNGVAVPPRLQNLFRKLSPVRSEEHTSELQSRLHLVCRLLLEKKKKKIRNNKSQNQKNYPLTQQQ